MHINNINFSQYKLGPYTWKYKSAYYTNIKKIIIIIIIIWSPADFVRLPTDKEVITL